MAVKAGIPSEKCEMLNSIKLHLLELLYKKKGDGVDEERKKLGVENMRW